MTSVSAGHIILTPTQLVGSGRPQRVSIPGPPDQESRALTTELPRRRRKKGNGKKNGRLGEGKEKKGRIMDNVGVDGVFCKCKSCNYSKGVNGDNNTIFVLRI